MIITNSVNRHLGQCDYTNISNNFYTFNICIYFTLIQTAEIILRDIKLLLMILICDCAWDDNV